VTSILGSAAVPAAFCDAGKMPALLEKCHDIMQSSIVSFLCGMSGPAVRHQERDRE
jgi:hypothetical protein